eukprot:3932400-Rhodomonas_salina.1
MPKDRWGTAAAALFRLAEWETGNAKPSAGRRQSDPKSHKHKHTALAAHAAKLAGERIMHKTKPHIGAVAGVVG